jgi:hypothetical protein
MWPPDSLAVPKLDNLWFYMGGIGNQPILVVNEQVDIDTFIHIG